MRVVTHPDEVTQGYLFISLGSGKDSFKKGRGCSGRRQGESFSCTGDEFIQFSFYYYSRRAGHTLE